MVFLYYFFSFRKKQSCANLQLIKYMNGMKAKKCEQTRMQLCDRRYLDIEHVNNFISQRLQVGNLAKVISTKYAFIDYILCLKMILYEMSLSHLRIFPKDKIRVFFRNSMFWCNIIHFFKFTYLTYFYSDVGLYFIINWSKMQIV